MAMLMMVSANPILIPGEVWCGVAIDRCMAAEVGGPRWDLRSCVLTWTSAASIPPRSH
jgi:hypothetical protein